MREQITDRQRLQFYKQANGDRVEEYLSNLDPKAYEDEF